ncbi:MAG: tetratricopeptide repeat protein [Nitrospirae bacterium]|nr:tetratricopeptide repeat protein [Nitrospirota bacterium]
MTANLTRHELYNIRLHKILAAVLYCSEKCWSGIRALFYLFSRKSNAMRSVRTGEIYEVQGETGEAIRYFRKALSRYPKLLSVRLNLCRSYLRMLSLKEAKEHGLIFLRKKPDDPEINLYIGVILYYEGKLEDAITHLEKTADLLPATEKKTASAFEYIGECCLKLQRYEDAAGYLKKSIAVNPYGSEKKYVSLGEAYYLLNKKEEALSTFKRALEVNPDNCEAWNNIGVLMWSVGNLENACKCFRKSIEINPGYKEARTNLNSVEESMNSIKLNVKKKVR